MLVMTCCWLTKYVRLGLQHTSFNLGYKILEKISPVRGKLNLLDSHEIQNWEATFFNIY